MSHCHYTPSRRVMSMAELNHNKTLNIRLADHLQSLAVETGDAKYASQANRARYCSTFWSGFYCESCGKFHSMHTTGCKHRLCPICATRQSRVTAMQAVEALRWMRGRREGLRVSLLTLTQRNVPGEGLSEEIGRMLIGWAHIQNSRVFRTVTEGWARTIEVVPGINQDGTYHPHVHALIVHEMKLPPVEWWAERWKTGMHLDYLPVCDLRPVEDEEGAVFEVSKYVSKLTRIYDGTAAEHDHVRYLSEALYNRRLRSYGGDWRKARLQLNMMDAEKMPDDALDEYVENRLDDSCPQCGKATVASCLRWSGLRYNVVPNDIRVIPVNALLGGQHVFRSSGD